MRTERYLVTVNSDTRETLRTERIEEDGALVEVSKRAIPLPWSPQGEASAASAVMPAACSAYGAEEIEASAASAVMPAACSAYGAETGEPPRQ